MTFNSISSNSTTEVTLLQVHRYRHLCRMSSIIQWTEFCLIRPFWHTLPNWRKNMVRFKSSLSTNSALMDQMDTQVGGYINPDISTPTFNPGIFNPRLFNHELLNHELLNHELLNHELFKYKVVNPLELGLVKPNLTNPTQIWPKFFMLMATHTRLDPNLDPEGPTDPKLDMVGFKLGLLGTCLAWTQFWTRFLGQPDPIQPYLVEPKNWVQIWKAWKKGSSLVALVGIEFEDFMVENVCGWKVRGWN